MGNYDTIKEGAVTIEFSESKDNKVKIVLSIDFGETDLTPPQAASLFTGIVKLLRSSLGVKLSKCS